MRRLFFLTLLFFAFLIRTYGQACQTSITETYAGFPGIDSRGQIVTSLGNEQWEVTVYGTVSVGASWRLVFDGQTTSLGSGYHEIKRTLGPGEHPWGWVSGSGNPGGGRIVTLCADEDPCGPMSGSRIVNNTTWATKYYGLFAESGPIVQYWAVGPMSSRSLEWNIVEACEPHYIALIEWVDGQPTPVGENIGDPIIPDAPDPPTPDPPENPEPTPNPNTPTPVEPPEDTDLDDVWRVIVGGPDGLPTDAGDPTDQEGLEEAIEGAGVPGLVPAIEKLSDALIPDAPEFELPAGDVDPVIVFKLFKPTRQGASIDWSETQDVEFDLAPFSGPITIFRNLILAAIYITFYFWLIRHIRGAGADNN